MKQVEDVGFGRCALLQSQLNGHQYCLLVMVQNQRQDLYHLPITPLYPPQMLLQPPKGIRQFHERCTVTQGARLTLEDRQRVAPVVNGMSRTVMAAVDHALMLANDLPFRHYFEAVGIDPQADRAIGEGGRHAVAIALQMDEAGRRDPLGMFHKTIERPAQWHQIFNLAGPNIRNRAWLSTVRNLAP